MYVPENGAEPVQQAQDDKRNPRKQRRPAKSTQTTGIGQKADSHSLQEIIPGLMIQFEIDPRQNGCYSKQQEPSQI
jgi:hypothetical protein